MSCTTCGSNANCGCQSSSSCGSSSSSVSSACSANSVPSSPQPFYACAPACKEDNKQKIFITHYSAALKVENSWNVPACGETATLTIPGLTNIVIGSYLWNEEYGYFEITAFDSGLQQVTVINRCNEGNAAPGTGVDACTLFVNTTPPADTSDTGQACVAVSFTAPAVSACIDITLTNTTNITAGDVIQIGSGFYRVSEIKPNDIINICNDGEGITPGTSVIATDAAGNYQYCISVISVSPCARAVAYNGAVIVCNSDNLTTTVDMPENGWIFEGTVSTLDNSVGAVPLGLSPFCSRIASVLNIISGTANYTITVDNSSGWVIGDLLQIAGYPSTSGSPIARLQVTGLPSGTQVAVTISPTPGANVSVPVDTIVCRIGCCELLQNEIDAAACSPKVFRLNIDSYAYSIPVTLDGNGYFEAVVDAIVIPIDTSSTACPTSNYAVKAHLSIASNANIDTGALSEAEIGTIYHEIVAAWSSNNVNGNAGGKIVYTDILGDNRVTSSPEFPAIPGATFTILPSPAPGYPLCYHQNDVTALAIMPTPGGVTNLGLSYRTLVGDRAITSLIGFTSIDILISGWVELYEING